MNGYLLFGFLFVVLNIGYCNSRIIECDTGCICDGDVCGNATQCPPYYYLQPVPPPEPVDDQVTVAPRAGEDETSDTETTTTTTAPAPTTTTIATTPTTTTTTTLEPTTTQTTTTATTAPPEPSFICVSQCYPGWYGFNGTCSECLVDRCALCTENGTRCLVCDDGWNIQTGGATCNQFSIIDITLITLTCIFGAVVLIGIICGIVMCVRMGMCDTCCAYLRACSCRPCGSCACPECSCTCFRKTKTRSKSVRAPGKDDILASETGKAVDRKSSNTQRYTREPTIKRKASLDDGTVVENPEYPRQYKTNTTNPGEPDQGEYAIPQDGPQDGAQDGPEETYEEVEVEDSCIAPPNGKNVNRLAAVFSLKQSKKPKVPKKPKADKLQKQQKQQQQQQQQQQRQQQRQQNEQPQGRVFRKQPLATPPQTEPHSPHSSRGFKPAQPLPVPNIDDNHGNGSAQYYNHVASHVEEGDPIYENVEVQPVYGNVTYENAQSDGIHDAKRDSWA